MHLDWTSAYLMRPAFVRGAAIVTPIDETLPRHSPLLRAERTPPSPIVFRLSMGKRPTDLMHGSDPALRLLSPAAVATFTDAGLTGWTTYPVTIDGRGFNGSPDGYVGLAVTGRCGPIERDRARSEVRLSPIGKPYRASVGLYVDPSSWDGSDLFMPRDETDAVLVSDRARRALLAGKLTNIQFEAMADFVWP